MSQTCRGCRPSGLVLMGRSNAWFEPAPLLFVCAPLRLPRSGCTAADAGTPAGGVIRGPEPSAEALTEEGRARPPGLLTAPRWSYCCLRGQLARRAAADGDLARLPHRV